MTELVKGRCPRILLRLAAGLLLPTVVGCGNGGTAMERGDAGIVLADAVPIDERQEAGVGEADGGGQADAAEVAPPPLLSTARALVPGRAKAAVPAGANPALVENIESYLRGGYGEWAWGAGEPYVGRTIDGSAPPSMGGNARMLLRFVHLADLQLMDDESPTRAANADQPTFTASALRPQEAYLCHLAEAAVRTINQVHAWWPLSWVILGGDNINSAQQNELDWLLAILNGRGAVACDSGADDDLLAGPANDPKDSFLPEGLAVPWWWVSGNHDELVLGVTRIDRTQRALARGPVAFLGTRDYSEGGSIEGPLGFVAADPTRVPIYPTELMRRVRSDRQGHGIGGSQEARGKAFYHFDLPGTPLRFVVLDTAAERGGAGGMLRSRDVEAFVRPALEEGAQLGKWVVMVSHHAAEDLTLNGGPGLGELVDDALTPEAWRALVGSYPNVLFSLVGHGHAHRAQVIRPSGGSPWWEVMTAAIADYPHQFRMIEIWDGDNGQVLLRATAVDLDTTGHPLAEEGRRRGIADYTAGWAGVPGNADPAAQNVELWIPSPKLETTR